MQRQRQRHKLPGTLWLQRLLAQMPLASATAMQRTSAASVHLSCFRHFRSYDLLPYRSEGRGLGRQQQQPARAPTALLAPA